MLQKRSFTLAGHRTSVALEPEFWVALTAIATTRGQSLGTLVAQLDGQRQPEERLASLLRLLALREARLNSGVTCVTESSEWQA